MRKPIAENSKETKHSIPLSIFIFAIFDITMIVIFAKTSPLWTLVLPALFIIGESIYLGFHIREAKKLPDVYLEYDFDNEFFIYHIDRYESVVIHPQDILRIVQSQSSEFDVADNHSGTGRGAGPYGHIDLIVKDTSVDENDELYTVQHIIPQIIYPMKYLHNASIVKTNIERLIKDGKNAKLLVEGVAEYEVDD